MKKFEFIVLGTILLLFSCGYKSTKENKLHGEINRSYSLQSIDTSLITSNVLKKLVNVNKVSAVDLPHVFTFMYPEHYAALPYELRDSRLPLSLTYDITGNTSETSESVCYVVRQFQTDGSYVLFEVIVGAYAISKHILVTYDFNGNLIDYMVVYYDFDHIMSSIQSELSEDLMLHIWKIKFISSTPVIPTKARFSSITGQRIDYQYKISPGGTFDFYTQTRHAQKTYLFDDIAGKRIKDGNEPLE